MIELRDAAFDPYAELVRHQEASLARTGRYGATCVFVGTMRDFNEGDAIRAMVLEHYAGMTERQLERIVAEAGRRWELLDVLLLHRVGAIVPGQPIVLVAVWAAHRGAAFDACRYLIEELKHRAPFWKKELLEHGERWVESNTPGF